MIEDPEGPHPHHGSSGIKWLDLTLAVAVILLSAASLWTAQHTGKTMQQLVDENSRLVRANSTPILQWDNGNVLAQGERGQYFRVANVGSGAARVIWFEIALDGKPMTDIRSLINYAPKPEDKDYITTGGVAGSYLPAGENREIVRWPYPTTPVSQAKWQALDKNRRSLVATACFCSVLDECWTSHLGADLPKPVKACDARGHLNFDG